VKPRSEGSFEENYLLLESTNRAVNSQEPLDITGMLAAWTAGDERALRDVMPVIYGDLRLIARKHLSRHQGHSVESGTLAHEAFLKLVHTRGIRCNNRAHFLALCAQMIRRILVDYARKRRAAKRGGELQVPLDEAVLGSKARDVEVEALDEALTALSKIDQRKSRVVELRFFGGLSVEETAAILEISEETVKRDWRAAKAWLLRELTQEQTPAGDSGQAEQHSGGKPNTTPGRR
jgi:RNA polymerase sigma-70 factor (ECF subfamily)